MILISNTGPIIALAKIQKLNLLEKLQWKEVIIPPMVQKELWGKISPESKEIESALKNFIQVKTPIVAANKIESETEELDVGEKQVILLGTSFDEKVILLIDDKVGRNVAQKLGLSVIGTLGILLLAKRKGLLKQITPQIHEIRRKGYWLSDSLVSYMKHLADEG